MYYVTLEWISFQANPEGTTKKDQTKTSEQLVLTEEKSLWGTDLYIAVDREVPDAEIVQMSGTFLTKVFKGPYRNMGEYVREIKKYVKTPTNYVARSSNLRVRFR